MISVELKFKFFDVENVEEMQRILDMSPEYSQEAEKLPNYLHWVRLQLGEARAYVAKTDVMVKKVEAELYQRYRAVAEQIGQKVTEKMLEAKIRTDENYIKAKLQLIQAREYEEKVEALYQALLTKAQILSSLMKAMYGN